MVDQPAIPPSSIRQLPPLWLQLPPPNRRRLLWLLTQLLERQLTPLAQQHKEGSYE